MLSLEGSRFCVSPVILQFPVPAPPTVFPSGIIEGRVAPVCTCPGNWPNAYARGQRPSVAIDDSAESGNAFLVAWQSGNFDEGGIASRSLMAAKFDHLGNCLVGPRRLSAYTQFTDPAFLSGNDNALPSVAMASGKIRIAWASSALGTALESSEPGPLSGQMLLADFNLSDAPATWPLLCRTGVTKDFTPSTGISTTPNDLRMTAFARLVPFVGGGTATLRLRRTPDGSETTLASFSAQGALPGTRARQWFPCAATNNGITVVCWAHAENTLADVPPFDIHMQLLDSLGNKIGAEITVNDRNIEIANSTQDSPAVDFYGDDIVIAWRGADLPSPCTSSTFGKVFARRYKWSGGSAAPAPIAPQFIVNTNPTSYPQLDWSPSVALSREGNGRWIAAWTTKSIPSSSVGDEIHAQFFENGRPMGTEFRVNQDTNPNGYDQSPLQSNILQRRLANSNQHTIRYGREGEVVCVWTAFDYPIPINPYCCLNNNEVFFTRLPPGYADAIDIDNTCCKGDMDGNGSVNLLDVPLFVTMLLTNTGVPRCLPITAGFTVICPADCNDDGAANGLDVQLFVDRIRAGATCGAQSRSLPDCNANEIPDANDIADGTSLDCNNNFIPDECDVDANDPDGNELVSADVDSNGVPDECQPDCNANARPDSADIACGGGNTCGGIAGSSDVNSNGIPDECDPDCNNNNYPDDYDIAMSTSADCNANGTPDECEVDCNANGVPDDCDIDPLDPDGDTFVSDDCDGDTMPDECNLTLPPPYGSFDCNENGILDECDIASEYSEDANANGVPDECEGGGNLMAPGGNPPHGNPSRDRQGVGSSALIDDEQSPADPNVAMTMQAPNQDAAWEALYDWAMAQCWGPDCELSPSEQFQAYVSKLAELGLTMP